MSVKAKKKILAAASVFAAMTLPCSPIMNGQSVAAESVCYYVKYKPSSTIPAGGSAAFGRNNTSGVISVFFQGEGYWSGLETTGAFNAALSNQQSVVIRNWSPYSATSVKGWVVIVRETTAASSCATSF